MISVVLGRYGKRCGTADSIITLLASARRAMVFDKKMVGVVLVGKKVSVEGCCGNRTLCERSHLAQ